MYILILEQLSDYFVDFCHTIIVHNVVSFLCAVHADSDSSRSSNLQAFHDPGHDGGLFC